MSSVTPSVYNNRYELTRQIARGGMAEVYLARDLLLDRPVALKMLFPELSVDRSFVERFRREAQAAANLSHPNIVPVFDWGEADSTYFIVMEYVDGRSLSNLLRAEGPLLADRAAAIGAEVASALAFAHSRGVIHRDVKPGNVLLAHSGQVKVTDFGIARASNTTESLTQTGAVMGTATYFSPEQAQGLSVDGRSDIYSLGVVLYEMVTGRAPFSADSPITVAYKHVRETPPPPREINPSVPPEFEAVILQAMAKSPDDRYQSAEELRADLMRYQQGRPVLANPALAEAPTTVQAAATGQTQVLPTAEQPKRDRRTRTYVILLIILLLLLGAVIYLVGRNLGFFSSSGAAFAVPNVVNQNVNQATQTLQSKGLNAKLNFQNNPAPQNTVFAQKPAPPAQVHRGDSVTLYVSQGPGQVKLPDVTGQAVSAATATLQGLGLSVNVQRTASSQVAPNTVISQNPPAGTQVNKGSTVTLSVSSGPGDVRVPDVSGDTQTQAANALGQLGLNVGNTTMQASSSVPQGQVISTNPPAGTLVSRGTTVDLVVSSGVAQVQVPNVVGQPQGVAQANLAAAGFKVTVLTQPATNPGQVGTVISQNPAGNTTAPAGSTVTITVGQTTTPGSGGG